MAEELWDCSLFKKERIRGFIRDLDDRLYDDDRDDDDRYNDWTISRRDAFADSYIKTLSRETPSPVQCCSRCSALLDDTTQTPSQGTQRSDMRATAQDCRVCTLLHQARHDGRSRDDGDIDIGRRGGALQERATGARLLRLCFDTANPDRTTSSIPHGLPILPRADSNADFGLLCAWLGWCDYKHKCNEHPPKGDTALPTRLLYVGAVDDPSYDPNVVRLVLGSDIQAEKYIALSHRWGNPSDEEKEKLCTSQGNIDQRLRGFSLFDLPETFRDAVEVTRQLRIPYLWIDSLCIIQFGDDNKDWQRESHRMEAVFSAAYCTLAATSARNWTTGFLKRAVTTESVYVHTAAGRQLYVSTDVDDFDKDVGDAELNKRAWVMQESVLARRTIHFSAKQTYFECGDGVYCENLTKLETWHRKKYFTTDPNFPNRLLRSGYRNTIEFIRFLTEAYSKRELTCKTDRYVAMSGLQTRIAHAIGCKGRYGTFGKYLHRNLLWHASGVKLQKIDYNTQQKTLHVPSWSWMAYDGGIRFLDEDEIPVDHAQWITSLRFHEHCEHALITDVGKFRDCTMKWDGSRYAVFDLSKTNRGWIHYDVEDGKNLLEEHCVVVGSTGNSENYYILVTRPTGVDDEYERVGMGLVQKNCLVRERENVRVV